LLAEVEEEEEAKAGHDGLLHERPGVEALVLHGRSGMGGEVLDGSRVGRHMLTLAGDDWRKQLGLRVCQAFASPRVQALVSSAAPLQT